MANQQRDAGAPPQGGASSDGARQAQQNVYGEGNYQATRDYNERTKRFMESGRVDEAARNAAPKSEQEAQEMAAAENEGRRHAKEEDPEITLPESDIGPEDDSAPDPGEE